MDLGHSISLLLVIAVGTYFQTVSGFGLGMIVIGLSSGLALAPAQLVANVLGVVTLVNCATALPSKLHHIDWPAMRVVLLGIAPSVVVGVLLLDYLSTSASNALQLLLGMIIMTSGVLFTARRPQQATRSGNGSFSPQRFAFRSHGGPVRRRRTAGDFSVLPAAHGDGGRAQFATSDLWRCLHHPQRFRCHSGMTDHGRMVAGGLRPGAGGASHRGREALSAATGTHHPATDRFWRIDRYRCGPDRHGNALGAC